MRSYVRSIVVVLCAIALTACAADTPIITVEGACTELYGGSVCTWANVQGENVVDIGATIPMATIEGAPHETPMAWPPEMRASVALPADVQARTGLNHVTIFWEAHGHPPGPYAVPHFDFHFHTTDSATRAAIDCSDLTKPAELPAGYALPDLDVGPPIGVLTGMCVPGMGMHALPQAELDAATPFRGNMVIGYYQGNPIFVEPMLTRELLLERKSFEFPIPPLPGVRTTHFRAEYDATAQAYRFTFSGFAES